MGLLIQVSNRPKGVNQRSPMQRMGFVWGRRMGALSGRSNGEMTGAGVAVCNVRSPLQGCGLCRLETQGVAALCPGLRWFAPLGRKAGRVSDAMS